MRGFKRGLRRGSIALTGGLIGAFFSWVMAVVIYGTDPLGPALLAYLVVFGLTYLAAVLADRERHSPKRA